MKSLSYLFVISILLVAACRKTDDRIWEKSGQSLVGKWTYTDYYYSIGGPGKWYEVNPENQTIEFKADGSFVPAASFLQGVTSYEILDSVRIKFKPAATASGFTLMGYSIEKTGKELYLYPIDPICIEGCNNRFRR